MDGLVKHGVRQQYRNGLNLDLLVIMNGYAEVLDVHPQMCSPTLGLFEPYVMTVGAMEMLMILVDDGYAWMQDHPLRETPMPTEEEWPVLQSIKAEEARRLVMERRERQKIWGLDANLMRGGCEFCFKEHRVHCGSCRRWVRDQHDCGCALPDRHWAGRHMQIEADALRAGVCLCKPQWLLLTPSKERIALQNAMELRCLQVRMDLLAMRVQEARRALEVVTD